MVVSAGPHDRVVCLPLCLSSLGGARVAGWRASGLCWEGTWWWAMALPGTWPWLPLLPTCFESPESAARGDSGATSLPPIGGGGPGQGTHCNVAGSQPRGNNRHLLGPPVVHTLPKARSAPKANLYFLQQDWQSAATKGEAHQAPTMSPGAIELLSLLVPLLVIHDCTLTNLESFHNTTESIAR